MTMNHTDFHPALGFIAGVLIGLSIITPVFGATSPAAESWSGLVTLLAVGLLVCGFALNAARGSARRTALRVQRDGVGR
jgi:hypothetical protein